MAATHKTSNRTCQQAATSTDNNELYIDLYRLMVLTRLCDDKAVRLQRTGQMGTYPSSLGQEAVACGTGAALNSTDVYVPYYRDQGAMIARGIQLASILRYWTGDERGSDFADSREDLPISIPIATQLLHAVGVAYAFRYRRQDRVVVTMCGDGATSEGDFYEALNLAGTWRLPVVFVINNNQWAISVPRSQQSGTETLAEKGQAAAVPGQQIDGNDVIQVYDTVSQAITAAREGNGPTLIECLTYRLSDHTTADDARRYCPQQDLQQAWQNEPIHRFKTRLQEAGIWDQAQDETLYEQCQQQVEQAAQEMTQEAREPAHAMFDHLYDNFPDAMLDQYETVWNLDK